MPLPFIVGGVWAGAAYLAHKSQKEVKQKIDEHNKIWDRIENISNSSKALAERTYDNYKNSVIDLDNLREDVFYGTLTDFIDIINKIKHIELENDLKCLPVISNETNIAQYNASNHTVKRSNAFASPILATGVAVAFGAIGGGLMFAQGKMKKAQIEGKIDEANTVLAKVRSESEQVKLRCEQLNYTASRLDMFYNVFQTLTKLLDRGIGQLQNIIQTEGTDYRYYSTETREQIMTITNLAKLLRDFVKEDIVDYEGDITYESENRFDECVNLLQDNGYETNDYYDDDCYEYYLPEIGDTVGIVNSIKRYWHTYDKSSKVHNVPSNYFTYNWKIIGKSNNKYMLEYNGLKIVLMQEEIYKR